MGTYVLQTVVVVVAVNRIQTHKHTHRKPNTHLHLHSRFDLPPQLLPPPAEPHSSCAHATPLVHASRGLYVGHRSSKGQLCLRKGQTFAAAVPANTPRQATADALPARCSEKAVSDARKSRAFSARGERDCRDFYVEMSRESQALKDLSSVANAKKGGGNNSNEMQVGGFIPFFQKNSPSVFVLHIYIYIHIMPTPTKALLPTP